MKKILIDVNETYLEQCRKQFEKKWGVGVSNSQMIGHLLFLHSDKDLTVCSICRKEAKDVH